MKTIQVYDPAMCCSTGVCGPAIDPALIGFASLLRSLSQRGVRVERYNLGQQPSAFVENPAVKELLEREGPEALPAMFWDGELRLKGRYPTGTERTEWLGAAGPEGRPA